MGRGGVHSGRLASIEYDRPNNGGAVYSAAASYQLNGNVASSQDSVNGNWNYGYDDFNRLSSASASSGPKAGSAASWAYDRYGNRWSQTATAGSFPQTSNSFSGITNCPDQVTCDGAGNVTNDGFHTYAHDGENRIVSVDGSALGNYVYDPEGRRVRSAHTEYFFNALGQMNDRFDTGTNYWAADEFHLGSWHVASYNPSTMTFYLADGLGTEHMAVDQNGNPCNTKSGLPFGDGLASSGSCLASEPDFYTGFERDGDSNLDQATFRQYASTAGHWMSPDPYHGSYDLGNPQSLNRYAYALNNPMGWTDPSGLCEVGQGGIGTESCDRPPGYVPGGTNSSDGNTIYVDPNTGETYIDFPELPTVTTTQNPDPNPSTCLVSYCAPPTFPTSGTNPSQPSSSTGGGGTQTTAPAAIKPPSPGSTICTPVFCPASVTSDPAPLKCSDVAAAATWSGRAATVGGTYSLFTSVTGMGLPAAVPIGIISGFTALAGGLLDIKASFHIGCTP